MFSIRLALVIPLFLAQALGAEQPSSLHDLSKPNPEQIATWIVRLGDDRFSVREEATARLAAIGEQAGPALVEVVESPDAEVAHRARDLLERIRERKAAIQSAFQLLDHDAALAKAKNENKLLLIDFHADWCGLCKTLDKETFSAEKVALFLKQKTIAIKINTDDHVKLAREYKVEAVPCLVFLDSSGKEVGRLVGRQSADEFLAEAGKFVK